jgi:flagellar motor switch protein FliN
MENETIEVENAVRGIELTELEADADKGRTLLDENHELIRAIKVRVSVSVGKCELTVKDLLALKEDAVLTLDKDTRAPVDILLDGKLIARGHLVAVDDNFGVRVSEISPG